jgi:hypothetical protein
MKSRKLCVVLTFTIAIFFSVVVIAFADSNTPAKPASSSLNETEPTWWIKALFTGFISALVIILAFGLERLAEWRKVKKEKKEFLQASCVELRHLLACLVDNYGDTKANLDGLSKDDFVWIVKACREFHLDKVMDPAKQGMPMPKQSLDKSSDDDLLKCAGILNDRIRKPDIVFICFARLDFGFIESNFPMIRKLESGTQELLFRIVGRFRNINECIEKLDHEYERSFTYSTDDTLSDHIQENKKTYYGKIASWSYQASNEIMKFLRENWMPYGQGDNAGAEL